ncbi:MAG TPA: alpha-glucuronidase family glycosyl hydrolase, partial [Phycisphaerae bacterium]
MKSRIRRAFIVAYGISTAFCTRLEGDMILAEGGVGRAVIVVAKDAPEPERHAAAELADFLHQVTGGRFDVVEHAERGRTRLLVGAEAAKLADPKFSIDGLGAEGFVIRTTDDELVLAGGRPRGTLYAV